MHLSAKGNGCLCTPKGNGIKDGFVSWVRVYAVVFWMLRFPGAILHVYFIFLNGLSVGSVELLILWFIVKASAEALISITGKSKSSYFDYLYFGYIVT